jgi:hypothetical protein
MVQSSSCLLCSRMVPTAAFCSADASSAALAAVTLSPPPPGPGASAAAELPPSAAGNGAAARGASGGCCMHASLYDVTRLRCHVAGGVCTDGRQLCTQSTTSA